MSREDRVEMTRMLTLLHGMVGLVVAAGGLLLANAAIPVSEGWTDGPLAAVGAALVVAGCLVLALAVTASLGRSDVVVHASGLAAAVVSAAAVVPLATVVGVTGWVVVATLPLALVSLGSLVALRAQPCGALVSLHDALS